MRHESSTSQESNTRHPATSRYVVFATAAAAVAAFAAMTGCATTKPTPAANIGGGPAAVQTLGSAPAAQPSAQAPATHPTANPTARATLAANAGGLTPIANPWSDKVYHPGFINAMDAKGRVAIQPAQFKIPAGTDTFVLVPLRSPAPKWYSLAPGAKLYVSALWASLPRPTNGTDFCQVASFKQFVTYIQAQTTGREDFSPEVWFVLNSKGQITLLFQVYHP